MNENLVKDCEQIMLSEFSEMHGQIKLLHEERTNLFDALRQLEVSFVIYMVTVDGLVSHVSDLMLIGS